MTRARSTPRSKRLAGVLLAALLAGCSPQSLLVRQAADALAAQGQVPEDDLLLARDAAPFYLKLSESVLLRTPDHLGLAASVAGGFTQYAYAFVAFDADRLQAHDSKAAQALGERARRLYARARQHALTALTRHHPGLLDALARPDAPLRLRPEEVATAYWAAASWAAQIALSKDQPEVVADLPLAQRLATLAWRVQPAHGDGALASLMGTLEAARPGGNRIAARAYFDAAVAYGAGRHAGPYVAQAEALAQPAGDRAAFEALLRQAIAASDARRDTDNEVMGQRARWLLATVDDRF